MPRSGFCWFSHKHATNTWWQHKLPRTELLAIRSRMCTCFFFSCLYLDIHYIAIGKALQRGFSAGKKNHSPINDLQMYREKLPGGVKRFHSEVIAFRLYPPPRSKSYCMRALFWKTLHKPQHVSPCMCTPSASPLWLANTPATTEGKCLAKARWDGFATSQYYYDICLT